jgi:hypothetical protein
LCWRRLDSDTREQLLDSLPLREVIERLVRVATLAVLFVLVVVARKQRVRALKQLLWRNGRSVALYGGLLARRAPEAIGSRFCLLAALILKHIAASVVGIGTDETRHGHNGYNHIGSVIVASV